VYLANDQFVFASEVKHLIDLLGFTPEINWVGWGQYLTYRFTLGSSTFFKGVELVGNGVFFEVDLANNTVKKTEYWNYSSVMVDSVTSFEDKVAEGTRVFQTVFNSLGEDLEHKRFILALSGGYDSRSIAAGLHKYMPTVSFDTVTTLHPCGSEIEIVRELACALGLSNKYVERPNDIYRKYFIKRAYATDGLVQEHLWALPLEDTIKNYDTHIDGIAGDIIMRSTRVRPIHAEKYMDLQYLAKLFKKQFGFEYTWLKEYIEPRIWEELKYSELWAVEQLEKLPNNDNRMTYFLMNNRVRNGISIVPSNMLGRFVPEVIQPFFDDRIALFGLSLPLKYKFSFIYRSIIDATYPEISHIRSTSDEDLEKLKNYDVKITRFDDNPRELINDYLSMSDDDRSYLIELLNTLEIPPFLDVKKFIYDEITNPRMNRINTIVDMMLWYNLFISKSLQI
jgi:asparagine synthase (glutamine-hydrolysing)